MGFALRFTEGKFSGGRFPLKPNREIIIGRGSEYDMVLDDDMVSRQHAKVSTFHGLIVLEDLESTNGTMVNGEAANQVELSLGDVITIGHSVMELVEVADSLTPPPKPSSTSGDARKTVHRGGLQGRFPDDGITVVNLIETMVGSGKPAALTLGSDVGERVKIYVNEGRIVSARLKLENGEEGPASARKALFRGLGWAEGSYKMRGFDGDRSFGDTLDEDTDKLIAEAQEQLDILTGYADQLPDASDRLQLSVPVEARLAELSPEVLDTLQLVINTGAAGQVIDLSDATDVETWQDLLFLIQGGYVTSE